MEEEELSEKEMAAIAKGMYDSMKDKATLLDKLKEDGKVMDDLQLDGANTTVVLLYLGKLIEGKFIEMENDPQFTTKGFDLAMDLIDEGWKLSEFETLAVCSSVFESMGEEAHAQIAALVCAMQDNGIAGMHEMLKEATNDNE